MVRGESRRAGEVLQERYRLEEPIGRGGMGEVWRASHTNTGRVVALKFFLHRSGDEDEARLFREAKTACKVRHPGVVEILDAFVDPDHGPVIVMELLRGETLAARLAREGHLGLEEAGGILLAIVEAVAAAHDQGVAHRDIKPANVLLAEGPDGQRQVKVLDFGLAKTIEGGDESQSSAGRVFGSPAYMAPEQCRGDGAIDHRADMWALGVLIHEVLSGERPVRGTTIGEVVENLTTYGIPSLRMVCPAAPLPLVVAVRRLLERERSARPKDLREIAGALAGLSERARENAPSSETLDPIASTSEPSTLTNPRKRRSSRPILFLIPGALLCVAAVVAYAELPGKDGETHGAGTSTRPVATARASGAPVTAHDVGPPRRQSGQPRLASSSAVSPPVLATAPSAAPRARGGAHRSTSKSEEPPPAASPARPPPSSEESDTPWINEPP